MAPPKHFAAERFLKLINEVLRKHHGVKAHAAKEMGLKQGHLGMLLVRPGVSGATIEKVRKKLKLNPRYFSGPLLPGADDRHENYLLSVMPLESVHAQRDEPVTREILMTPASLDQILDGLNATEWEHGQLREYVRLYQVTLDTRFVQGFIGALRLGKSRLRAGDEALSDQIEDDSLEPDDE